MLTMNHNRTVMKLESKLVKITRFVATGDDKTSNFSLQSEYPNLNFVAPIEEGFIQLGPLK